MKIKIDRKKPFDPKFIGEGWTIESEDPESLKVKELDLSKVKLQTNLKPGETYISGEDHLKRLVGVKLDGMVFKTLWEDKNLIPESWKQKTNGWATCIHFPGTIFKGPDGNRRVLCLFWYDGEWGWDVFWLSDDFDANYPSALLASSKKLSSKPSEALNLEDRVKELEADMAKIKKIINL